ncbi:MAG: hypothetical protein M1358_06755 [Chloroflexi bacterium]|nr:hypothetical protein [Chloroflexota bacterium]
MEIVTPALIVLITGSLIVSRSRLIAALSIGADYVLVGLLLWQGVSHSISLAYAITGLTAGAIICLYGSAPLLAFRRVEIAGPAPAAKFDKNAYAGSPPMGWVFVTTTLVLCMVVAFGLSSTYPLGEEMRASYWESFVSYWLIISGLLAAAVTRNPLRSGSGLLLLICGVSLSYVLVSDAYGVVNAIGLLLVGIFAALIIGRLSLDRREEASPEVRG